MKLKKWLIAGLTLAMAGSLSFAVAACAGPANGGGEGEGGGHSHTYTQWAHDDTQHWKACPDDGAEDPAGRTGHNFVGGECECGATEQPHQHTYDAWDFDDTEHWKYCDEHGTDKSNIDESTREGHTFTEGRCECGATEEAPAGDWVIGDDGVITEWTGSGTELTLPKTVGGTAVKKIAATAFAENANAANITKLYVGCFTNGFNYFESGALDALTSCTEVVYNENWEQAGNSPIYNQRTFLAHVTKVTFTEEVLKTPQSACAGMTALENVEFKGEVKEFRASLFANSGLTEITLPASLESYQASAFTGMKKLAQINYAMVKGHFINFKQTNQMHPFDDQIGSEAPNGVKLVITDPGATIGEYTFYGFTHLKSIEWHAEGMGTIAARAFMSSGVTHLTIPAYFTSATLNENGSGPAGYGDSFQGMEALETLTFEPGSQITVIPNNTFLDCSSLRKVELPEGVTALTSWTFRGCTSLREVVLPSTLTSVSYQAFYEDTLDSLTINKTDGVLLFKPSSATDAGLAFSADGKIYVPSDLVEDYKADTNWKLLADKIVAIPEIDPEQKLTVNWFVKGTDDPVHTDEVTSGSELTAEDAFTPEERENYTFYGWYSDPECTKKVDFPVTVREAKNFYGEYRENIVLDKRSYFLAGDGQGTIKASKWALGASAPASCKFVRDEGTNTYRINNFELYVGDQMKIGFASKWGATTNDSNYAFGAYFFSKNSNVFESSTAWDANAKVASGKSGKYNIILVTQGANTDTTAKAENQIVSLTFELVESYDVRTEDMGWYLTGAMNSWNATAPDERYKLTETAPGSGIWEATITFSAAYEMKAIHFTKTTKGSTVSYASEWSGESNHSTPSGTVKITYNSKTDHLTHTTVTAAAAPVAMIPARKD